MLKFRKAFNSKIISLVVAITFFVTSSAYGIDLSNKSHLRIPIGIDDDRTNWALYRAFYGEKVDRALTEEEAIKYLEDKGSDTTLVLNQETMKTRLTPKKDINIGQIEREELRILKLKEGKRFKGRRYVLIVTEITGGKARTPDEILREIMSSSDEGSIVSLAGELRMATQGSLEDTDAYINKAQVHLSELRIQNRRRKETQEPDSGSPVTADLEERGAELRQAATEVEGLSDANALPAVPFLILTDRRPEPAVQLGVLDWDGTVMYSAASVDKTFEEVWFQMVEALVPGLLSDREFMQKGVDIIYETAGDTVAPRIQSLVDLLRSRSEGIPEDSVVVEKWSGIFKRTYERHCEEFMLDGEDHFVPGVLDLFDTLKRQGVPIVVATAIWRSLLDNVIVWAGLDGRESPVNLAYSAGKGSPEDFQMKSKADVILEAEKVYDVKGTTVMVGDSPYDIKAAKEADVFCIGVSKDPDRRLALARAGADVLITDYTSALPQLLEWLGLPTIAGRNEWNDFLAGIPDARTLEKCLIDLECAVTIEDKARIFEEITQLDYSESLYVTIDAENGTHLKVSIPLIIDFHRRILLFEAMVWWIASLNAEAMRGININFYGSLDIDLALQDMRTVWEICGYDFDPRQETPFRIVKSEKQRKADVLIERANMQVWGFKEMQKVKIQNIPRVPVSGRKPRILFIASSTASVDIFTNKKEGRFISPHFGLYRLKTYLERNGYAEVDVFDPDLYGNPHVADWRLAHLISQGDYQIIGFSPTHSNLINDFRLMCLARKIAGMTQEKNLPIFIVGGNEAAYNAEDLLKYAPVDLAVVGYGEKILAYLAQVISSEGERSLRDVLQEMQGVAYIDDQGAFAVNPPSLLTLEEFEEYTFEDQPIVSMPYRQFWIHSAIFITPSDLRVRKGTLRAVRLFFTSHCAKGIACGFCTSKLLTNQPLLGISAEQMAKLVEEAVVAHDPKAIYINDDDALMGGSAKGRERFIEFCNRIIEMKKAGRLSKDLTFYTQTRTISLLRRVGENYEADTELLRAMKKAGFVMVSLGVESFSDNILKAPSIDKKVTADIHRTAIDGLLEQGITPQLNIIGLPPETTKDDLWQTISESVAYAERGAQLALTTYVWYLPGAALEKIKEYREQSLELVDLPVLGTDITYPYRNRYLPFDPEIKAMTREGNIWNRADEVWEEFLDEIGGALPFRSPPLLVRVLMIFIAKLELLGEEEKAQEIRKKARKIIETSLLTDEFLKNRAVILATDGHAESILGQANVEEEQAVSGEEDIISSSGTKLTPVFFHRRNLIQRGEIQTAVLKSIDTEIKELKPNEMAVVMVATNNANEIELRSYFGEKAFILNLNSLQSRTEIYDYFHGIITDHKCLDALRGEGLRLEEAGKYLDQV